MEDFRAAGPGDDAAAAPTVPDREHALVWAGGLVALLTEFGSTQNAARVALTRMVQRELLARQRDGRLVRYQLTHAPGTR